MGKCSFTGELTGLLSSLFGGSSIRKMASAPAAGLQLKEYQWEGSYLVDQITSPTDIRYFRQGRSNSISFLWSVHNLASCYGKKLSKVRSYLSNSLKVCTYVCTRTYSSTNIQIKMTADGPMATFSPFSHFQTPSGEAKLHNELTISPTFSSYKFKHQLRVYLWCWWDFKRVRATC